MNKTKSHSQTSLSIMFNYNLWFKYQKKTNFHLKKKNINNTKVLYCRCYNMYSPPLMILLVTFTGAR